MYYTNLKISKPNIFGVLLGIAAATGHATSLRFFGFVGLSEFLFLVIILYLFCKSPYFFLKKNNFYEFITRSYLLFSTFLVLPLTTILYSIYLSNSQISYQIYVLSFILGITLIFLITESIRADLINLKLASLVFLVIFIIMNFYALWFEISIYDPGRYSGFSNNPNQLIIYITSLMLMLVAFRRKLFFLSLPFLIYIGLESRSDTFLVIIASMIFTFIFLSIFNYIKLNFFLRMYIMSIVLIGLVALAIFYYFQELIIFLASADGDLVRLKLMYNGFLATLHSPFIGLGVGSFSGLEYAFQGSEAHNTFLDLSMQFGIIVPIILYFVIFAALFKSIKNRDNLLATIIVAFFICSLFNFYARHFVFWLVIGFLYYYYYTGFKPQK
jgi:hypothetical protein